MPILNPLPLAKFLERYELPSSDGERIAILDCDYTMILGDIGELMFYRQIARFQFRMSPADLWPDHPERQKLDRLYRTLERCDPESRARHPSFGAFADALLSFYSDQLDAGGVEKGCADIVRLFAGFTRADVWKFADETFAEEIHAAPGEFRLGSRTLPRGIRFIREIVDLANALHARGFAIWAISGSNKWSVEPVFRAIGVERDRVIGIDLVEHNGIFTGVAEEPIPIREKKVLAFRARSAAPVALCASDSRNDIPLLLHATDLRVYVNSHGRRTDDFFRNGNIQRDDSWIVIENPAGLEGLPGHG